MLGSTAPAGIEAASTVAETVSVDVPAHRPALSASARAQRRAGMILALPYMLMLAAFGVFPAVYVVYLSFVKPEGGFTLLGNFRKVAGDYRYLSTFAHVGQYAVVFLIPSLIVSIGLALLLEGRRRRSAATMQLIYYLPHGLVGPAGVVVWLFLLTPGVSPIGFLLRGLGYHNLPQVVSATGVAVVLAIIALWSGGNALLMLYAALRSIPTEMIEAARLDGANAWRLAIWVKLPMLRKWLAYVLILNIGGCVQLFAEPQLLSNASSGSIANNWSPLQLAYTFAYQYANLDAAAALSVQILVVGVLIAVVIIRKFSMFQVEI